MSNKITSSRFNTIKRNTREGSSAANEDKIYIKIIATTDHHASLNIPLNPRNFPQQLPALQHFTLKRGSYTGKSHYDKSLTIGQNIQWDGLNKQIKDFLKTQFKRGTVIEIPNQLHQNNASKNEFFKVNSYVWLDDNDKPSKDPYKFFVYLVNNSILETKLYVHLYLEKIDNAQRASLPEKRPPPPPAKTTLGKISQKVNTTCKYHVNSLKNMIRGIQHSQTLKKQMAQRGAEQRIEQAGGKKNKNKILLKKKRTKKYTKKRLRIRKSKRKKGRMSKRRHSRKRKTKRKTKKKAL